MIDVFYLQLVAKNILKFCLRGMLQERQRTTLFGFLTSIQKIFTTHTSNEYIQELRGELDKSLALMERDFPIAIQVRNLLLCY